MKNRFRFVSNNGTKKQVFRGALINDLVDISKIEAGQTEIKIEKTDVNRLLDSLFSFFEPEADAKNIKFLLKKELSSDDCVIITDKTKLTQIISNLLKNAIKYTDSGYVSFGNRLKEGNIEFYVKDTGKGVKPELKDKIFERFNKGDFSDAGTYEGTGLGLSICKAYSEMLGGEIKVDSEPDKGSVFYFSLPYKPGPGKKEYEKMKKNREIKNFEKTTALIAEDDEISFLFLEEVLNETGITILQAKNGLEALEIAKSDIEINLVLIDIKMPGLDGLEVTKQIKKLRPGLPVIVQTAFASYEDKIRAMQAGCDDYISKPIDKDLLMAKINNLLKFQ